MVRSGWVLLTQMGFAYDIGMTVWRVCGGFAIAALFALPLGLDLCDRRRTERRLVRYRPHDHRQPGAARHRSNYFRHIVIGLIGLVSDYAFKSLNVRLFRWAQLGK